MGTRQRQDRDRVAGIGQGHGAIVREMSRNPIVVVSLGGGRGDHIEVILGQLGHGDVTFDAAQGRTHLGERHASVAFREFVRAESVEKGSRARTGEFVGRKTGL